MTATDPQMINCGSHGERISAVVCKHLLLSEPGRSGFIENNDDPHDLQAWCYACEDLFEQEGGMTDTFREFNGMAVVCVTCYAEAKVVNTLPAH